MLFLQQVWQVRIICMICCVSAWHRIIRIINVSGANKLHDNDIIEETVIYGAVKKNSRFDTNIINWLTNSKQIRFSSWFFYCNHKNIVTLAIVKIIWLLVTKRLVIWCPLIINNNNNNIIFFC